MGRIATRNPSLWVGTSSASPSPALGGDRNADVVVIGAGIAGLTTAYLLGRKGRRVVVIDDGAIGSGMSGRTTAHLSSAIDDRFTEIERLHGEEGSRICYQSHAAAVDMIESISRDENIACEFRRVNGYLFPAAGDAPDHADSPKGG